MHINNSFLFLLFFLSPHTFLPPLLFFFPFLKKYNTKQIINNLLTNKFANNIIK